MENGSIPCATQAFKIGVSTNITNRIHNHHGNIPLGFFMNFYIVLKDSLNKVQLLAVERNLSEYLLANHIPRLHTTTRINPSEWWYADFMNLQTTARQWFNLRKVSHPQWFKIRYRHPISGDWLNPFQFFPKPPIASQWKCADFKAKRP